MNYLAFREALLSFQVFSIRDIQKLFPDFDTRRLVEWQEKGYILKLVNKWYLFNECKKDVELLLRISNCIYRPSYVSLETALAYYHFIPEAVYSQTAVTTRKTISYTTPVGHMNYHRIRPELYFGYTILHKGDLPVLIADREKAILDYLYLHPSVRSPKDISELRLNHDELNNQLNIERMGHYQLLFRSKVVDQRVKYLKEELAYA